MDGIGQNYFLKYFIQSQSLDLFHQLKSLTPQLFLNSIFLGSYPVGSQSAGAVSWARTDVRVMVRTAANNIVYLRLENIAKSKKAIVVANLLPSLYKFCFVANDNE